MTELLYFLLTVFREPFMWVAGLVTVFFMVLILIHMVVNELSPEELDPSNRG